MNLALLAIERIKELGNEAYSAHQQLIQWRAEPLSTEVKTQFSGIVRDCLEKQNSWATALREYLEKMEEAND